MVSPVLQTDPAQCVTVVSDLKAGLQHLELSLDLGRAMEGF